MYLANVTSTTASFASYPLESKSKYYLSIDAYNGTSLLVKVNRRFLRRNRLLKHLGGHWLLPT